MNWNGVKQTWNIWKKEEKQKDDADHTDDENLELDKILEEMQGKKLLSVQFLWSCELNFENAKKAVGEYIVFGHESDYFFCGITCFNRANISVISITLGFWKWPLPNRRCTTNGAMRWGRSNPKNDKLKGILITLDIVAL